MVYNIKYYFTLFFAVYTLSFAKPMPARHLDTLLPQTRHAAGYRIRLKPRSPILRILGIHHLPPAPAIPPYLP